MVREHAIIAGEKYGKYTAIESKILVTKSGLKTWKWLCKDEKGREILKRKIDLLDQLTEEELLRRQTINTDDSVKNHTNQMGIRRRYFSEYKRNSSAKNHNFEIDFDYFNQLISSNCYYCGRKPIETTRWKSCEHKTQPRLKHNGIDRVDSNIGYTQDNTVSCCSMCNIMKNVYSQKDFLDQATRIHLFNNKSSTTIPIGSTLK